MMLRCRIDASRLAAVALAVGITASGGGSAMAADPPSETPDTTSDASQQDRFRKFESLLTGAKLVGHFTLLGQDNRAPAKEEYTIRSVEKTPQGDYWLFNARIRYGTHDLKLPLPLEVKWAGDTPVITLTNLTVPGLGTFSSRVVIYNNKYAGTWTHGEVGGHLFGVIEKLEADAPSSEPTTAAPADKQPCEN